MSHVDSKTILMVCFGGVLSCWGFLFISKLHMWTRKQKDIYHSLGTSHVYQNYKSIYIDKYWISIGLHHIRSKSQYLKYPILMISSVKPCNILTKILSFIFWLNFFCLHSCSFADGPFLQLQLRILLLEPLKDLRICWIPWKISE